MKPAPMKSTICGSRDTSWKDWMRHGVRRGKSHVDSYRASIQKTIASRVSHMNRNDISLKWNEMSLTYEILRISVSCRTSRVPTQPCSFSRFRAILASKLFRIVRYLSPSPTSLRLLRNPAICEDLFGKLNPCRHACAWAQPSHTCLQKL